MVSHLNKYIRTQIILGVFGGLAQVWEGAEELWEVSVFGMLVWDYQIIYKNIKLEKLQQVFTLVLLHFTSKFWVLFLIYSAFLCVFIEVMHVSFLIILNFIFITVILKNLNFSQCVCFYMLGSKGAWGN